MSPERVIPNNVEDPELLAQHKARYQFASQFVQGKNVLDIACGTGYGTEILLRGKPSRIVGVDISDEAVIFAKTHYAAENVQFQRGDAEQLFGIEKIDVVTSFETIEHLSHPKRFLERIGKLLTGGGTLIISTPLRVSGSLDTKPGNPFHVREWSEEEFCSLLSGYSINCVPYFQYLIRKRSFPGSRTLIKAVWKVIDPKGYEAYIEFPVTKTPPNTFYGALTKGFLILVCTI